MNKNHDPVDRTLVILRKPHKVFFAPPSISLSFGVYQKRNHDCDDIYHDHQSVDAEHAPTSPGLSVTQRITPLLPDEPCKCHERLCTSEAATYSEAALLGANILDVFLSADAYWRNIPEEVWNHGRLSGDQEVTVLSPTAFL